MISPTIGSRPLTKEQAKRLLPGYEKVIDLVKTFRENAREENKKYNKLTPDEKITPYRYYDNTISILGGRGSGKTSVLLTLKKELSNKTNNDVILPIILPEHMSPASDTMGWILGYLNDEVKKIIKEWVNSSLVKSSEEYRKYCNNNNNHELMQKYKETLKSYQLRKIEYYEKSQRQDDDSIYEYIDNTKKIIHADQNLINNFKSLIDCMVETIKKVKGQQQDPLVIVTFDDVDISAEKCPDVLDTIRTYLTHQNIAVIVSGDSEVFSEALTIHFLDKEKVKSSDYDRNFRSNSDSSIDKAINTRKIRSQEYLKKVLPPSYRFDMQKVSQSDKANFSFEGDEIDGYSESNHITLKELLESKNHHFRTNRLYRNNMQKKLNEVPNIYFRVFDDNPRGLMNAYFYLYQKHISDSIWTYNDYWQFLNVIVNSSLQLKEHKELIFKFIVIPQSDQQVSEKENMIKINYHVFSTYYIKQVIVEKSKIDKGKIEDLQLIFILGCFFEFMAYQSVSQHGAVFASMINDVNGKGLFPKTNNTELLFKLYGRVESVLGVIPYSEQWFTTSSEKESMYSEMFFLQKLLSNLEKGGIVSILEKIFQEDEDWTTKVIDFIFRAGLTNDEILELNHSEYTKVLKIDKRLYEIEDRKVHYGIDVYYKKLLVKMKGSRDSFNQITKEISKKIIVDYQNYQNSIEKNNYTIIDSRLHTLFDSLMQLYVDISRNDYMFILDNDEFFVDEIYEYNIKEQMKIINKQLESYFPDKVKELGSFTFGKEDSSYKCKQYATIVFEKINLPNIYHVFYDMDIEKDNISGLYNMLNNICMNIKYELEKIDREESIIISEFQKSIKKVMQEVPREMYSDFRLIFYSRGDVSYQDLIENTKIVLERLEKKYLRNNTTSERMIDRIILKIQEILNEDKGLYVSEYAKAFRYTCILSSAHVSNIINNVILVSSLKQIYEDSDKEVVTYFKSLKLELLEATNNLKTFYRFRNYITEKKGKE